MPFKPWSVLRRATFASEGCEPRSGSASVNSARSCASVSRIKAVISWECSRAFVKILGLGKLQHLVQSRLVPECSLNLTEALQLQRMTRRSAPDDCPGASL